MELQSKVEKILEEIEKLEEDYKAGEISKANYEVIRKRYEKELEEVKQELSEQEGKKKESGKIGKDWVIANSWNIAGIIGSLIATYSVFMPWGISQVGEEIVTLSGLEIISINFFAPVLVFIGGLYALVGGIGILVAEVFESSMEIGGTFVLVGGVWGFIVKADISSLLSGQGVGPALGCGIYLAIIGSVIILVSGLKVS